MSILVIKLNAINLHLMGNFHSPQLDLSLFPSGRRQTGVAVSVEHDFVTTNVKALWSKGIDPPDAADQIEELLTLLTEEEMMMMLRRALVVRGRPGDFDHACLAVCLKVFEGSIDGRHSQSRDFLLSLSENFMRGQRTVGFGNNPA